MENTVTRRVDMIVDNALRSLHILARHIYLIT
jgi:hypothetical protein